MLNQDIQTVAGSIAVAAEYIGYHEVADHLPDTPMAASLIAAGVAFEQLMAVALLARSISLPGGTNDLTLMRDLRKALADAAPVMAREHYGRMAIAAAQKVAA